MTENKRFMLDDAGELIDKETAQFIEYGEKVCNLLNELATKCSQLKKENEQLKEEIEKLAYANDDLLKEKREWKKLSDEYAKIYDENKELKFQLKECREHKLYSRRKLEEENKELKNKINTYKSANKLQQETIKLLREDNGLINITNVELFKLGDEDD